MTFIAVAVPGLSKESFTFIWVDTNSGVGHHISPKMISGAKY